MLGRSVTARFHGGQADGTTLILWDYRWVWITMFDGTPKTIPNGPGDPDFELINRAAGTWERYARADNPPEPGIVPYHCDKPLGSTAQGYNEGAHMPEPTGWTKSSKSATNQNCVEARRNGDRIQVRDSKDPAGPTLLFTPSEFAAFVAGAADGDFNHLLG